MADRTPRRQSHAESSADLIDLSNGNSSAFENAAYETPGVEEFDPLFARALSFQSAPDLQLQADSSQMPRPQSVPSMQSMESSVCTEETTIDEVPVPPSPRRRATNFAKQLLSLAKYRERISKGLSKEKNVCFIAPTVDYMTTTAGTIKVVVTTDKTWPFLEANVKRKLTFTCNVNQTCAEILSTVLLEFLPPEELSKNEGQIPLDEYVLKSNRTDEFFDNEAVIGKHPFVGFTLAVDKDVELCHPRILATTLTADHYRGLPSTASCRDLQKERPDKGRSMNHTLSLDVVTALNSFATANRKERIKKSVKLLTDAVLRQLYVFSRSAVLDLSFKTQLVELPGNQQNVEELSTFIENDFMICVESLHNIPHEWSEAYSRYHVEFELQNALVELNFQQTPKRASENNGGHFRSMGTSS
ncbi:hypothetical protein M3Y99_00613000 [Aphelenchoides fujianensis]|nr:hypothetical protein M3Y99_00613000 [Aphelenchoides fujianensis]